MTELERDIDRIKTLLLETRIVTKELAQKYRIELPKSLISTEILLQTNPKEVLDYLIEIQYKINKGKGD